MNIMDINLQNVNKYFYDNSDEVNYYLKLDLENKFKNNFVKIFHILSKKKFANFYFFMSIHIFFLIMSIKKHSKKSNIYLFSTFCISIFLTDLITGIVHIYLDNSKIRYNYSLLDYFRTGFEVHHRYPTWQWITNKNYKPDYEMNTIIIPITIFLILNFKYKNNLLITLTLTLILLAQFFHYSSHAIVHKKKVYNIIEYLQNLNIILHPDIHKEHHTFYDRNYCILNGWANFLLNRFTIGKTKEIKEFINYIDKFI